MNRILDAIREVHEQWKGGSGSGNFGHSGRPGKHGGSAPGGGGAGGDSSSDSSSKGGGKVPFKNNTQLGKAVLENSGSARDKKSKVRTLPTGKGTKVNEVTLTGDKTSKIGKYLQSQGFESYQDPYKTADVKSYRSSQFKVHVYTYNGGAATSVTMVDQTGVADTRGGMD